MQKINLREELAKAYSTASAAHKRGVIAPDLLRHAIVTLRTSIVRLLLPRLTPEERARMISHSHAGIQELMLVIKDVLSRYPDLSTVLGLSDQIMKELQDKDLDLHTAIQRATAIAARATAAERSAGTQLKELTARILKNITTIGLESEDYDLVLQAACIAAAVAQFEERIDRGTKRRRDRVRKQVDEITKDGKETLVQKKLEAKNVVVARDESLLPAATKPGTEATKKPPAPQKGTRRKQDDSDYKEDAGAPLETCLTAAPHAFAQVIEQLGDVVTKLEADPATAEGADGAVDYVFYLELGALLSVALAKTPAIAKACGADPEELSRLCVQADESALLRDTSTLFSSMASDGHLFVCSFTMLVYNQTLLWFKERLQDPSLPLEEIESLRFDERRLRQIHTRPKNLEADRKARAQETVQAAKDRITAAVGEAEVARIKDRLSRDLPVEAEELYAAESVNKQLREEDLGRIRATDPTLQEPSRPIRAPVQQPARRLRRHN